MTPAQADVPQGLNKMVRAHLRELVANLDRVTHTSNRDPFAILVELLDRSPYAALLADKVGVFTFANAAASLLTGYTSDELRGMSFLQLTPHVYEGEADILWRAFVDRGEQSGQYQVLVRGGLIIDAAYAAKAHVLPGVHLSLMHRLT
jgi:PAS domain S-box-containing protein